MEYNLEAIKEAISKIKIEGDETLLPLDDNIFIAGFALILEEDIQPAIDFFNFFAKAVSNDCSLGFIDRNITQADLDSFVTDTREADLAFFAIFCDNITPFTLPNNLIQAIQKISVDKKTIFVIFNFDQKEILNNLKADLSLQVPEKLETALIAAALKLAGKGFFDTIINP
jgi:hypothetical protein